MQKEKKIFTYYLVTPNTSTEALVNLDEYFFDKDTNVFAKDGDPHSVIKLD